MNAASQKSRLLPLLLISIFVFFGGCCENRSAATPNNLDRILDAFHEANSKIILVAAHRAVHTCLPENSLAAIERAIELGADIVEIDARTTQDGVLVLMHDSDVDRTTDGEGKVKDFTFAELQQLVLKKRGQSHPIPTLHDALLAAKNNIMVDIDIKGAPVKKLVDLVQAVGVSRQVIFFTRNFSKLDSIIATDSTLIVMPRAKSADELDMILSRYHPEIVHIDNSFFTDEVVQKLRSNGSRIWINALGAPDIKALLGFKRAAYSPLVDHGADVLQTDLPQRLLVYLQKSERHW